MLGKEAAVFSVELADALVADLASCDRGVHPIHKHPLPCPLQPQLFHSKAPELTQLARCPLNRYLLILKRLILESSVRAGSPNFVAAPDGPEIRP